MYKMAKKAAEQTCISDGVHVIFESYFSEANIHKPKKVFYFIIIFLLSSKTFQIFLLDIVTNADFLQS